MTSRQVSKDQHWPKDKIQKERTKKEAIETAKGWDNEEKEKEVEKKMMEILFVNVFSSTVCDAILQEQKDMQVNETDEGLAPTKDEGTCLRRLSMFRKEVH